HRQALVARASEIEEHHSAQAADDTDRHERRLDEREAQLRVREERLVAEELQVVVAAELRVAAEIDVPGELAPALEPAGAEREDAVRAEPHVITHVQIGGLTR